MIIKVIELRGIGSLLKQDMDNNVCNIFNIGSKDNVDCIGDHTNVIFRIAYILWVLRGSNTLLDLSYYSNHLEKCSDNGYNLRGAYGPRLMNWIGADQLQEAIDINMNIDNDEDFVKPNGVNQISMMYEDLHDCEMESTTITIADPAIDFDSSKDVPDLHSCTFRRIGDELCLMMNYTKFDINENHINDVYLMEYIQKLMAGMLSIKKGNIIINAVNVETYDNSLYKYKVYKTLSEHYESNNNMTDFYGDIFKLFNLDRHLRNMINESNLTNEEVSASMLVDTLERKIINELILQESKNMAYVLLIGAIKIYVSRVEEFEEYILEILKKMSGTYKEEICRWLLEVGDIPHSLHTECTDTIDV